jgi:glyoxylase-like metal-dependent hydrolase (beta-lactamase superfamily II)
VTGAAAHGLAERDLAGLGVTRIPVPVPFPQAGGPVNVYLVEEPDGGLLMFDAGLGSPEGHAALEEGFARAGRRFDEVRRIVLSHGHVDHYGAAVFVMERAGRTLPVFAHPADVGKVSAGGKRWRDQLPLYGAYLAKLGVPAETLAAIAAEVGGGFTFARRIPEVHALAPGEVLHAKYLALEVMHMPGHTPGLTCLFDRRHGLFFAGDHLLEKVSPNPIIELGPDGEEGVFRPLVAYVESLARLHALPVELVLPGHGPPFGGHRQVIDGLLGFYAKRQGRIREVLAKGALTAHEVTQALFPWARAGDLFLVVSEAIANLELLETRGEVSRSADGGVYRFRLAG